eukprot:m51a1_g1129 hypothetical protein (108) ;mRNA; r:200120-200492
MPYESDCILSDTKKAFIKSELNKYEAISIYVKDTTIWKEKATLITVAEFSPVVFQICGDYCKKNAIMVKIKYPMQYTSAGENDEETSRFLGFAQWLAPFISNYTDVL